MLYLESEDAMQDGRPGSRERAIRAPDPLRTLAERGEPGGNDAVPVANGALNAENLNEPDLAEGLYPAGRELNPARWGNVQNYADFLLQHDGQEAWPRADGLVQALETTGQDYKPDKTTAPRLRLEVAGPEG